MDQAQSSEIWEQKRKMKSRIALEFKFKVKIVQKKVYQLRFSYLTPIFRRSYSYVINMNI